MESSIQKLNEHHRHAHNPQMCGICNRMFTLASSLTRHMYDHEEKTFNCDMCNYSSHFESVLETHKVVHRKQPSHQCMHANCGKWFRRKWDLTLHLQKHDGTEMTCDYVGCKFKTATKKQRNTKSVITMTFRMNAKHVIKVFITDRASSVTVIKNIKKSENHLNLVHRYVL